MGYKWYVRDTWGVKNMAGPLDTPPLQRSPGIITYIYIYSTFPPGPEKMAENTWFYMFYHVFFPWGKETLLIRVFQAHL